MRRPNIAGVDLVAPVAGQVAGLPCPIGSTVTEHEAVVVLEVMKMEVPIVAGTPGTIRSLAVAVGDSVAEGDLLASIDPSDVSSDASASEPTPDLATLDEVAARHRLGLDDARPEAIAARRERGRRTARENLADLCEDFVEYGPLAIAAQRGRAPVADLIRRTPADGMIGGIGRIATGTGGTGEDDRAVIVSYDYTVLAGTQGMQNHRKKDRLFVIAAELGLPLVLFAEGGGGRPGDVDWPGASLLDVPAFRLFAEIPGPTIGINTGYCFAGNAALLGQCDVIIATPDSNLGMGGPAMIEGGGLGAFRPGEVGPTDVQTRNGVIDVLVNDDAAAVVVTKNLLGLIRGWMPAAATPDQTALRGIVPATRRRLYEMRDVINGLLDQDCFLEVRPNFAPAAITGFGRVDGHPVGIIANDPAHLAGAIDHDAATSFARHMRLCDKWGIPILFLCDTPGFMVGPAAEAEGLVRSAGVMFKVAAELTVPTGTIVTRRGYGLGAQAMAAGGFHEGRFTVGWPNSEFGPMGLEGAAKLGFKKELESIEDDTQREVALAAMVAAMYEQGRGLNVASHFEIDDVIDPADSRRWISTALFG